MSVELLNFIETVLNGLMSGIMYSLVALGFVLIFKASGVFNFAQGVFALFAALTLVGFQTGQVPFSHLINELFGTKLHHWYPAIHSFLAIILSPPVNSFIIPTCNLSPSFGSWRTTNLFPHKRAISGLA